jgi:hypothetical protein
MRTICLDDQVRQERTRLIRLEIVDRFPIQLGTEAAEQAHDQLRHGDYSEDA